MSPGNDERCPWPGTESSRNVQADEANPEPTRQVRQDAVWHAVATVYRVRGVRGRLRSVLVVASCPWCRCSHVHTGKADFTVGKRTASCHGGRYLVHTGFLEGERAA